MTKPVYTALPAMPESEVKQFLKLGTRQLMTSVIYFRGIGDLYMVQYSHYGLILARILQTSEACGYLTCTDSEPVYVITEKSDLLKLRVNENCY